MSNDNMPTKCPFCQVDYRQLDRDFARERAAVATVANLRLELKERLNRNRRILYLMESDGFKKLHESYTTIEDKNDESALWACSEFLDTIRALEDKTLKEWIKEHNAPPLEHRSERAIRHLGHRHQVHRYSQAPLQSVIDELKRLGVR
jgi:hypothetical protein